MKNSELLEELRENILHDRSDRTDDSDNDYMWTDATLYRYINEAHMRFARNSLCLRDGNTPEVTQITLKTGVTEYPVHASVLAVVSAKMAGEDRDLVRTAHTVLSGRTPPDAYYFDVNSVTLLDEGKPIAFTCDDYLSEDDFGAVATITLRVYPPPSADYNDTKLDLRVCRLPIETINAEVADGNPEIPEMHHLDMLDWAAYLALRIVDTDAGSPARAKEFRTSFESHALAAKKEAMRKLFAPVGWRLGRNGYSWSK